MKVIFLKEFGKQKKGQIKNLDGSIGSELIRRGIAQKYVEGEEIEEVKEKPKKKTKKKK